MNRREALRLRLAAGASSPLWAADCKLMKRLLDMAHSRLLRSGLCLLLLWALGGCATSGGSPAFRSSQPHTLRAMSDGPPFSGDPSQSPIEGYNVPGRSVDSQLPWEFFLGNAAHRLIAYMYGVNHPQNEVFYNQVSLFSILSQTALGNPSLLNPEEVRLRPDITDVTLRQLFEIKPSGEAGLLEARQTVQIYLVALNRAAQKRRPFLGGTNFQGQILIRFARGQHIWRLEWWAPEPGVVQYRWTRSQQRFASEEAAYKAGQWTDLTAQDLQEYGGWVAQAVEGMVSRRERLATFSGVIGVVIDIAGDIAVGVFSGALTARSGTSQGGGQVIPFPQRAPPVSAPVPLPSAAGR